MTENLNGTAFRDNIVTKFGSNWNIYVIPSSEMAMNTHAVLLLNPEEHICLTD
jgi:hypothetical protein